MKTKKIIYLSLLMGLGALKVNGQTSFSPTSVTQQTPSGKYTAERVVENMIGSMYMNDNWQTAVVKLDDGRSFKNMQVKYNLVDDILFFRGEDDSQFMKFLNTVTEVKMADKKTGLDKIYRSGYPAIGKNTTTSLYQVIFEGKVKLLKKETKTIIEAQNYNSPSSVKNIDAQTHYYFVDKSDKIKEIKLNKKAVTDLMKDKSGEIDTFVKGNNIDFKSDSDLERLFNYYNSLI